jgi:3-isopropylmalate/(R)-2-methylmalate dehydratase small subunit
MMPVSFIAGTAVVLDDAGLDTGQILPPRFRAQPRGALFQDRRTADPGFPLRPAGNPPILLAGPDFGCGAAQEEAVLALLGGGIRCVITIGFGGIFCDMAAQWGLLTVVLVPDTFASLRKDALTGAEIAVDLERERIGCGGLSYRFRMDRFRWRTLLAGMDERELTRDSAIADAIDRWEGADARRRPWATPT